MASSTSKADIRDDVPPSKEQDSEDADISPEPQESEQSGIEGTEETGDGNSESTMVTMEDRKAKLDKLRAKMTPHLDPTAYIHESQPAITH
ncbi:hypothetical protein M404DRAFT_36371 [Pisolithus tinctorius Marx 270]|uniref:Uncharacterized protein n=1 Tax=Pisolithus tinctorius Marx 270 TaxID=870435 RepID=A0A0C3MW10_PISTI|nr:hypothetical protein M404DRAFT_36371 [Pisolithus tinctorius Marx 270]